MKTIIAEKPSIVHEIARIMDTTGGKEGYFEGGDYAVTWAFGHLVQLAMPDGYGVHGFVRDNLPIIPDTFTFVPHQVRTEKGYRPDSGVVSQIKVTKRLFDTSERIIVTIDAGREGEFIFRYLYHYMSCTTPFVCLRISSLIDKAIHEGLRKLENGNKYNNLYLAAKARSESDWLVSINDTQALSIAIGHGTYSVGRMQTPTLAMICERYWENRRFTSEVFWLPHITTDGCDGEVVKFSSSKKWKEKKPTMELYNRVKVVGCVTVAKARHKEKTGETPLLCNLTTFQKEVNAKRGFAAERALEIAQKLYKKKLVTCPRTGSRCTPEDMFAEIPKLLVFIDTQPEWKDRVRAKTAPTRRGMDDGKVADHHALFVMSEKPLFLSKEDNTIYQMIAGRMAEVFFEKCIKGVTAVTAECVGVGFTVKGSVMKQTGRRAVYGKEKEEIIIPGWQEGDTLTPKGSLVTEGKIRPRPLHTEITLPSAMETMNKGIEDDALRQVMKDCSIGTPAIRISIIETFFRRSYMECYKKLLIPTGKGLTLNSVVKTIRIVNVAMTGGREKELAYIEHRELSADTLRKEVEAYTREITPELLSCDKLFGSCDSGYACPRRGTGRTRFYDKVVRCDNMECELPVFRLKAGRILFDDEIRDLLTKGHAKLLKGFKSRQGKNFDAAVAFDGEYNMTFVFPETKKGKKFSGWKK